MLGYERVDSLLVEVGEYLDVLLSLCVADVEPELVESVRSGASRIEPDVSALGLAELLAVALGDEWAGEAVAFCVVAECAVDKLCAGGHVAPLVVATELQAHAVLLILVEEVVALEQLVCELCERKTVASFAVETLLHAVLSHHVVDGDVLANLASEVEEGEVLHPVVVVDELCLVRLCAVEVEELRNLLLDSLLVVVEGSSVEQVALLALARGVANHTGSTAHEQVGLVTATLQVAQHHDTTEVTDVERVGCRVGAQIRRHHVGIEILLSAGHNLREHTAPAQFFNEILCHYCCCFFDDCYFRVAFKPN